MHCLKNSSSQKRSRPKQRAKNHVGSIFLGRAAGRADDDGGQHRGGRAVQDCREVRSGDRSLPGWQRFWLFECKNCSSFLMVWMVDRTDKSNYMPFLMCPEPTRWRCWCCTQIERNLFHRSGSGMVLMCRLQDTLISFEEFVQIMDTSDVEHKMSMKFVGWVNIVSQGIYMIRRIKEMRWIIMYRISGHFTAVPPRTGPKRIQNIYSSKSGQRSRNS